MFWAFASQLLNLIFSLREQWFGIQSDQLLFPRSGGSHWLFPVSERPCQKRDTKRVSVYFSDELSISPSLLFYHVWNRSGLLLVWTRRLWRDNSSNPHRPPTLLYSFSCSDLKMTAILDQKHYIEELNRHLSGTVTDLQAKMDCIEKTNRKLVEEVSLSLCACALPVLKWVKRACSQMPKVEEFTSIKKVSTAINSVHFRPLSF